MKEEIYLLDWVRFMVGLKKHTSTEKSMNLGTNNRIEIAGLYLKVSNGVRKFCYNQIKTMNSINKKCICKQKQVEHGRQVVRLQ